MSEYWKSTPKYWCKHCKVFVRDTKPERLNHDSTPRHQGNVKRFVQGLHREHEKEEREKQRAKAEIARLNGAVAGGYGGSSSAKSSGWARTPAISASRGNPQAAPDSSRKEQLQQLIDLGVAIPDEFRPQLSMSGDWQVISERVIDAEADDKKPEHIGYGIRNKRAAETDIEEEAEDEAASKRRRWQSSHRTHDTGEDDDLDALLDRSLKARSLMTEPETGTDALQVKTESALEVGPPLEVLRNSTEPPRIKREISEEKMAVTGLLDHEDNTKLDLTSTDAVVFKKRARKNIRQR